MREKFIVLDIDEWNDNYLSRGMVVKKWHGDNEAFFCQYDETSTKSTLDLDRYEQGDIIEATLTPSGKHFKISDIKFINKLSWINLK